MGVLGSRVDRVREWGLDDGENKGTLGGGAATFKVVFFSHYLSQFCSLSGFTLQLSIALFSFW